MWPDHPFDFVKVPNDHEGVHYGLFVGGTLTSVISLFFDGERAQFRKLATLQTEQGKGYGSQLLRHAIQEVKAKGAKLLWCNARMGKTDFYHRFGMRETDRTYVKGGIDFVVMEVEL